MKKACLLFICLCLGSSLLLQSAFADHPRGVTSQNIMITNDGILINVNGNVMMTDSITYVGSGLYSLECYYYGQCGRCGWPFNAEGKCPNMNCDKYGPPIR